MGYFENLSRKKINLILVKRSLFAVVVLLLFKNQEERFFYKQINNDTLEDGDIQKKIFILFYDY